MILKFQTSCNSSQFKDLENLIGSLHISTHNYGHLIVRDMGLTIGQRKLLKRYENIEIISSKYIQKENIQLINVEHEFVFVNKSIYNRNNKGKYNYIDAIRKRFYLAIVIPFIQRQFKNLTAQLDLNQIYPPCRNRSNSIDLIFYHNENRFSLLDKQTRQLNYQNECFNNIRFLAADLSGKDNRYPVGSAIMWKKLFINEEFSDLSLRSYGYTHFFLMEPDARPIRSYWLDAIVEQIISDHNQASYLSTKWWMIGSIYRGSEQLGQYFLHINGNALYHLSLSFIQFLEYVSTKYPFHSIQSCGYDLDIFVYLFKNIDKGKNFWHKFQFSDFIQNCWHTGCNETSPEFLFNNPNTYLIHGNKIQRNIVEQPPKTSRVMIIIIILILFLLFILKQYRFTSQATISDVSNCPAGYYCLGKSVTPVPCPAGTWSGAGAAQCTPCQTGQYSTGGASSYCTTCEQGHYCTSANLSPQSCPMGTYNGDTGKIQCTKCRSGHFSDSRKVSCSACPAGHYTIRNGSSHCNACPIGHFCLNANQSPIPCPPGTANPLHNQSVCAACASGRYSARSGATVCDLCPTGSYCVKPDEPPVPCPAGSFCLEGQVRGTPCYSGYQTTLSGQSYCRICSPGHYCPNLAGSPIPCQRGYANDKHGRVACDLCPPGTYANMVGQAYCTICPAGYSCGNCRTAPISCPSNKARGQTVCTTE